MTHGAYEGPWWEEFEKRKNGARGYSIAAARGDIDGMRLDASRDCYYEMPPNVILRVAARYEAAVEMVEVVLAAARSGGIHECQCLAMLRPMLSMWMESNGKVKP